MNITGSIHNISTMRCEAMKKSDMLVVIFRSDNIKVCSFTCLPMLLEVLSFSSQPPSYGSRIGSTGNLAGGYVFVSVASLLTSSWSFTIQRLPGPVPFHRDRDHHPYQHLAASQATLIVFCILGLCICVFPVFVFAFEILLLAASLWSWKILCHILGGFW